jgi:DNA-binding CsgD family transcriptional regulator
LAEAQALLDEARRAGFAEYSMCHEWPTAMAWWAEAAALTSDAVAAAELIELLQPLAGRLADSGIVVTDTVDRVLALLALTVGDVEGATAAARRAVTASRRRGMPIMLGRELLILAAARRRGGVGREVVEDLVTEAVTIADQTGAGVIHHDVERFHLDDAAATASDPGHDELTMRERDVLELLATGADNRRIASELGISPATVRKHLEHAYAKLHVSTRTGAVARFRQEVGARTD